MLRVYGADLLFFDGPSEAWAAARALASEGTGVALDYRFVSDASGAEDGSSSMRLPAWRKRGKSLPARRWLLRCSPKRRRFSSRRSGRSGLPALFPVYLRSAEPLNHQVLEQSRRGDDPAVRLAMHDALPLERAGSRAKRSSRVVWLAPRARGDRAGARRSWMRRPPTRRPSKCA